MQILNCKLQIVRGTLGSMAKTPQDGYLRIVMTHHISSLSAFIRTPPRKSAALLPRVNPRLGQLTVAEATNSLTSVYRQMAERRLEPSSISRAAVQAVISGKMRSDALVGESRPKEAGLGPGASSKDAVLGRAFCVWLRPSGDVCAQSPARPSSPSLRGNCAIPHGRFVVSDVD